MHPCQPDVWGSVGTSAQPHKGESYSFADFSDILDARSITILESSPAEFHRKALAEPGVSVSTHPAPIIQPRTDGPHANARTTPTDGEQPAPASAVHDATTVPAFGISS